jgi:SAM-dependent methyltransferase
VRVEKTAGAQPTDRLHDRYLREQEFHNAAIADGRRQAIDKFYSISQNSFDYYRAALLHDCQGKRVLEYGCGTGSSSFLLGQKGARVTGIDISEVAIDVARERAEQGGLEARFQVMNAEELLFEDGSFEIVCGAGILHHLDLRKAYAALARVLTPGGRGVFFEPLGHNPLINVCRWATPALRTPDEHPLLMPDIALARSYYGSVEARFFNLTTLAAVPFRSLSIFEPVRRGLERVDGLLFAAPPLRRYAWQVVLTFSNPIKRP